MARRARESLADGLAGQAVTRGHSVIRATTDSFHRPRADRYRCGPTSPQGYYLDSHDLAAIRYELLEPFGTGAARVQVAAFDEPADAQRSRTGTSRPRPSMILERWRPFISDSPQDGRLGKPDP